MADAEVKRILMIGRSDETMKPAYAEHRGERVEFGVYLRDGRSALVKVPKLSPAEAAQWVRDRMARFHRYSSSRESVEDAVRRKAIAAQGRRFLPLLKAHLDEDGRMEVAMMFSPDSHSQGVALDTVRRNGPITVTVSRTGEVHLSDISVRDNLGRHLKPDG